MNHQMGIVTASICMFLIISDCVELAVDEILEFARKDNQV